jgi:hypothetical protein
MTGHPVNVHPHYGGSLGHQMWLPGPSSAQSQSFDQTIPYPYTFTPGSAAVQQPSYSPNMHRPIPRLSDQMPPGFWSSQGLPRGRPSSAADIRGTRIHTPSMGSLQPDVRSYGPSPTGSARQSTRRTSDEQQTSNGRYELSYGPYLMDDRQLHPNYQPAMYAPNGTNSTNGSSHSQAYPSIPQQLGQNHAQRSISLGHSPLSANSMGSEQQGYVGSTPPLHGNSHDQTQNMIDAHNMNGVDYQMKGFGADTGKFSL